MKPTKILALLAFSALSIPLSAQETTQLSVVASNAEGVETGKSIVTVESKLRFSDSGVEVYSGEMLTDVFHYADVANLKFAYGQGSGVAAIPSASGLHLRNNPVGDLLEPLGLSAECAALSVTDLSGKVHFSAPQWSGQPIDVSDLTPGLYLLTINKTTLKFIKK